MFGKFLKIILNIQILIFLIAFVIIMVSQNTSSNIGFIIAHVTGFTTLITLIGTLIFGWKTKYWEKSKSKYAIWSFIFLVISLSLMSLGYFFFVFEHISPYSHAISSLNFDIATSGASFTNVLFIKTIMEDNLNDYQHT
jgi:hypothetical protein